MARTQNLSEYLTDIATAIKTKKGDETPINASKFDEEIANLPSGGGVDEYFAEKSNGSQYVGNRFIKKFPPINKYPINSLYNAFQNFSNLIEVPIIDTTGTTTMQACFRGCSKLPEAILDWDTSKVTDMMYAFQNCTSLKKVDMSKCNTSNVQLFNTTFGGCKVLEEVSTLDASSCTTPLSAFTNCVALKTFGGFTNLGKAYSTASSAGQASCQLDFNSCTLLTHDSLMNIINGLYDIGSLGIQPQNLRLGTTNKNKLTASEVALATSKGWIVG